MVCVYVLAPVLRHGICVRYLALLCRLVSPLDAVGSRRYSSESILDFFCQSLLSRENETSRFRARLEESTEGLNRLFECGRRCSVRVRGYCELQSGAFARKFIVVVCDIAVNPTL
jgi:hypothetical protein